VNFFVFLLSSQIKQIACKMNIFSVLSIVNIKNKY